MEGEGRSPVSIERLMNTGYEYNYPRRRRCTGLGGRLYISVGQFHAWVSSMHEPWLLLDSAVTHLKT
jgi:hypothetical protein